MIIEYHRPKTIEEALALLGRATPQTIPLAGGTAVNRTGEHPIAVVDLQSIGLRSINRRGNFADIGAMTSLQDMLESSLPQALLKAVNLEASYNLRQVATVAGTLVAADGRSPLTTTMLALDAALTVLSGTQTGKTGAEIINLGDLLPMRDEILRGRLVTQITIPTRVSLAYASIARTPADLPIICAALAVWPAGRVRLALGGFGKAPALAFDGGEAVGIEAAARNACAQAGDQWASAEYRQEMAGVLAIRCLEQTRQVE